MEQFNFSLLRFYHCNEVVLLVLAAVVVVVVEEKAPLTNQPVAIVGQLANQF